MSKITINSYGHSCFKVTKDGYSIVLDPYKKGSVPGVELPEDLSADCVLCSHDHGDHNAKEAVALIEGNTPTMTAEFITVPHDDVNGAKRGMNKVAILNTGGIRIVHFGDIGRVCTEEEYAKLQGSEVIMIPVGGFYTIDARQAKEIADRIGPKVTVLMHYRSGSAGYEVLAPIEEASAVFGGACNVEKELVIDEEKLISGTFTIGY